MFLKKNSHLLSLLFSLVLLYLSYCSFPVCATSNELTRHSNSDGVPQPPVDEYCSPSGLISDACCEYETVEHINQDIYPKIHELVKTDFFKYYKLNLYKECPFWSEDGQCMNRACSVETADKEDVPEILRNLAAIQTSPAGTLFQPFKRCEFRDQDFCVLDDEADIEGVFVNLQDNPERFTGYAGSSAGRVWKSIYEENCFNIDHFWNRKSSYIPTNRNPLLQISQTSHDGSGNDDVCFEKRVYYRLISGLHSSISIHICDEYFDQTTGEWRPDLDCFISRVGSHPERIQNVYFNYVVLLRAISKMAEYLKNYDFCAGGEKAEDVKVKEMVNDLVRTAKSCPGTFDEKLMFTTGDAPALKEEFKARFRNVSRIMDCVGCDKCRLWGKLQISGIGTALKILFSYDDEYFNPKVHPSLLTRTEIVALFNAFNRFSESIKAIERFREIYTRELHATLFKTQDENMIGINASYPTFTTANNQTLFDFITSFRDSITPLAKEFSNFLIHQLEHWHIPVPVVLEDIAVYL